MPPEPPLELFQDLKVKRAMLAEAAGHPLPTEKKAAPRGAYSALVAALLPLFLKLRTLMAKVPWRWLGRGVLVMGILGGAVLVWQHRVLVHDYVTQWVAQATGATVQKIEVEGLRYTDQDALLGALGLERGSSLVGFDAAAARARIEDLPWVRLASVERQLPAAVKIQIYEHVPLARVIDNARVWVINPQGQRIVVDDGNQFTALPLLQGEGADRAGATLFDVLANYPQLMSQLREAIYVGGRRWDLRFVSGVTIQLPEEDPARGYGLTQALPRLVALEEARHVLTLNDGEVDLRLKDRIVLRLPETVGATPVTNLPQTQ
jgi:cell division protein FtsQ